MEQYVITTDVSLDNLIPNGFKDFDSLVNHLDNLNVEDYIGTYIITELNEFFNMFNQGLISVSSNDYLTLITIK